MATFSFLGDGSNFQQTLVLLTTQLRNLLSAGSAATVVVRKGIGHLRTLEQNDRLQAACGDLADQVRLRADGKFHGIHEPDYAGGRRLSKDDFRHIIVAALRGQEMVPGINGGFVVLGASSRELSIKDCSDCLDLLYSFGNEHLVEWSEDVKL